VRTSETGRKAIQAFEGCRLTAYRCQAGVLTVGYGHTGPDVRAGTTITQEHAELLLANGLGRFERCVTDAVAKTLHQHEFDALVSLAFNIGTKAFVDSTLVRKLNAGDYRGAAAQFTVWHNAAGAFNPGLLGRRTRELLTFVGYA
jgi:lysozyme